MSLWYDKKAYALLKKCSDNKDMIEWNVYREDNNYTLINLRFTNLRDFYLTDADLQNVDFRGSNLKGIKCIGADIANANISTNFYWKIYGACILGLIIFVLLQSPVDIYNSLIMFFLGLVSTVVILGIGTIIIGSVSDSIVYVGIVAILGFICGFFVDIGIVGIQSRVDVSSMSMIFINVITFLGSMVIIKKIIDDINYSIHKSILYAQNLKKSLGFDVKYMKGAIIPTSIKLANKITMLKKHLKKVKDEKEKQELQKNLEEVQKEKEHVLEKEAHAKTQQIKIQNALNHILKPYEYIEKNISKLRKHNYFFYGVIIILLSVFTYALFENYIDTRTLQFQKILEKDSVSFGAIFGVILFYSTPILFGMSIIVYAITQINKNIQSMETMQEQRRAIEVLQSTLLAQTEIADVSDDEIKALTQALQKGALERMFGQDKISQGSEKATSSYREKLLLNSLNKFLMQALKK